MQRLQSISFSRWLLTIAVVVACMLSSCVTSKKINLMQEPTKDNRIPSYTDTIPYADYELSTGDRLHIRVHSVDQQVQRLFSAAMGYGAGRGDNFAVNNQAFTGNLNQGYANELYTYLVLEDGTIDFPLIGKLYVRGMNTRQIKYRLEDELATYIKDYGDYKMVSVDVNVIQRMYSVISERGSGNYSIRREKMTIYEAIAQAGDLGEWSDRSKVKIVREKEGVTKVIEFDIRSKDIINSEYYYVEPNDVIYVQQLKGKAFGINRLTAAIAVTATTISFGGFVYGIVQRIINAAK